MEEWKYIFIDEILFAGYGVYAGDEIPVGAIGWMADMLNQIAVEHPECPATNPKLELDDGGDSLGL